MTVRVKIQNKVLLFDFDGTLVESEILAKKVIDQYFAETRFPDSVPLGDLIVGRTWGAATTSIYEHAKSLGVDLPKPSELKEIFQTAYKKELGKGVPLIPGLKKCLPYFKTHAKFIGIVTGSEHEEVNLILKFHGLEGFFDRIWAVGDYEKSKPDPSPYLQALKDIPATPEETLVFEDSKAGMESASQAGLAWVQVSHEAHAKQADPRSLLMIHDWDEIWL